MKKTVSALALAGSLAFLGAGGAQANHDTDYPSAPVTGTVSDGTVAPGESFIFSGTGFNPGEPIAMEVSREDAEPSAAGAAGTAGGPSAASPAGMILPLEKVASATTTADAAGNFSHPFDLDEIGLYTLEATGLQSGHVVTSQVVVHAVTNEVALAKTGGVPLANTGLSSGMLIWGAAGLGALVFGAGSVVAAKRRAGVTA
ncbi:LPXTG cell wall anchor domain-containing protein [Arthrobacter sp. AB6]|uniref:LPXTG cell wall anchor domain-containing protein n=1 Tax=Arthrobacter sp. AB6 TaxID=2962570 RepID=UPI002882813F|nr:LPXTG cell wall anchor domain-containing protein [Arthrobacter sp. AB6]MDT0193783.1 LPXTG cell wall anchor domain-containing protein [Arthrobacter sp. AB6]